MGGRRCRYWRCFDWRADADALVAADDREMQNAARVTLDEPGRTLHVFARGENGAVVVDLWESEEDFHRMVDDPEFQRNVEGSDWPGAPEVEIFQVYATMP
jgi:heme-degrading monooxygenase HmoA